MDKKSLLLLLLAASFAAIQADVPTTTITQPDTKANALGAIATSVEKTAQLGLDAAKNFSSLVKARAVDYATKSKTYLCNLYNQSTRNQRIIAGVTTAVIVGTAGYLMWKHFRKAKSNPKR